MRLFLLGENKLKRSCGTQQQEICYISTLYELHALYRQNKLFYAANKG